VVRHEREVGANCPSPPAMVLAWQFADYIRISDYLRRFSQPGEMIFVGLNRRDKIWVNHVGLYFSAERRPATHWHQFDPCLQTRAEIQIRMIGELTRNHVRWVVRDASYDSIVEPNQSSASSGVHRKR
jgi:hypothetical protein